jgi:hypothetical protein
LAKILIEYGTANRKRRLKLPRPRHSLRSRDE